MPLQMQLLCFLCIAKMNSVDTDFIYLVTAQMQEFDSKDDAHFQKKKWIKGKNAHRTCCKRFISITAVN